MSAVHACIQHPQAHDREHESCAGDSIASCSGDKTVRIWSRHGASDTWICAAILEETHHRSIRCSSWSPDGRNLATASFDASTAIWEVQVYAAYSAAQAVLSVSGTFHQLNEFYECLHIPECPAAPQGSTWEQVALLEGHESEVKGVAWSSSGKAESLACNNSNMLHSCICPMSFGSCLCVASRSCHVTAKDLVEQIFEGVEALRGIHSHCGTYAVFCPAQYTHDLTTCAAACSSACTCWGSTPGLRKS